MRSLFLQVSTALMILSAFAGADVLATVDSATLTWDDVLLMIGGESNVPYLGVATEASAEEVLQAWVREELMVQAAESSGLSSNAEVAFLIEQARRQILLEAYMSQLVTDVQPSQLEVENYAGEWLDTYKIAAHVRHIIVNEALLANSILAQIRGGGSFESLAQQYSIGPSGADGGDLGWITRGQSGYMAFDETAFTLSVGEMSSVVETGAGFHIIEVLETELLTPDPTLADITEFVEMELIQAMQEESILSLVDDLRLQHDVQLYPERLLQHIQ